MLFLNKIEVVQEYDEVLASPSIRMKMPAVVRLKRALGSIKRGVKFSRLNVLTRDNFKCQYCGEKKQFHELNYDHVTPRSQGGRTNWENIISACFSCNRRKGNRTPEQAGMTLLSKPYRPKSLPLPGPLLETQQVNPAWESWVGTSAA